MKRSTKSYRVTVKLHKLLPSVVQSQVTESSGVTVKTYKCLPIIVYSQVH